VSNDAERLITGTDVVTPRWCAVEVEPSDWGVVDVVGGGGLRDDVAAVGTRPTHRETAHELFCHHVNPTVGPRTM